LFFKLCYTLMDKKKYIYIYIYIYIERERERDFAGNESEGIFC
jgi:hypothetical protein